MFLDMSLHHMVRSSNAACAEQNSPTAYVSIIKHEINKKCLRFTKSFSEDPQMWRYHSETHFRSRLCRCFVMTRFRMF